MSKTEEKQVRTSSISIVDGKLILSLPNAESPVVWQMDLRTAQSSAFTIEENKKNNAYALNIKHQDGNIEEIALFNKKDTAVDILMETSTVMQNAHGKIHQDTVAIAPATVAATAAIATPEKRSDKLGAVLAILLSLILLFIWIVSASVPQRLKDGFASNTQSQQATSARSSSGVAVSADDFLNNR